MTLIKYNNGLAPVTFSNLFDTFFGDEYFNNKVSKFSPNVDIVEGEKAYEIHAAIPGVNKEDFKIEFTDGVLNISGERKFTKEENSKSYKSVETHFGSFSRSFYLPDNADSTKIEAEYVNGILKVIIPKDEHKKLSTSIVVK